MRNIQHILVLGLVITLMMITEASAAANVSPPASITFQNASTALASGTDGWVDVVGSTITVQFTSAGNLSLTVNYSGSGNLAGSGGATGNKSMAGSTSGAGIRLREHGTTTWVYLSSTAQTVKPSLNGNGSVVIDMQIWATFGDLVTSNTGASFSSTGGDQIVWTLQ